MSPARPIGRPFGGRLVSRTRSIDKLAHRGRVPLCLVTTGARPLRGTGLRILSRSRPYCCSRRSRKTCGARSHKQTSNGGQVRRPHVDRDKR